MARAMTKDKRITLLPPALAQLISVAMQRVLGAAMILLAIWVTLACISHDPSDPSLNTAGDGLVSNRMGTLGADVSDFLLQTLGLGASAVMLLLAGTGLNMVSGRQVSRFSYRVLAAISTVLLAATGFAAIPPASAWSMSSSMGGGVGMLLLNLLNNSFHLLTYLHAYIVAGTLLAVALFLGQYALALRYSAFIQPFKWLARRMAGVSIPVIAMPAVPAGLKSVAASLLQRRLRTEALAAAPAATADVVQTPRSRKKATVPNTAKPTASERTPGISVRNDVSIALPSLDLLSIAKSKGTTVDKRTLNERTQQLNQVLQDFGIKGEIVDSHPGPVVTLYEMEPAPGIKSARIISLADDIARSMSSISARVAVVPGRNVIGIELPNAQRETVLLRQILAHESFEQTRTKLPLALGKDIGGNPVTVDLAKMPHLLVAGTTGSGKSVAVNAMILSLLYKLTPQQCRFIMIDPKMLELSVYDDIPHLLTPVVTDPKKAVVALKWTVREMEQRYQAMSKLGVRNIEGYNERILQARDTGEVLHRRVQTGYDPDTGKPVYEDQPLSHETLPYIVVIVDEMADLMLVAGKDIEATIQRLAQMARAAGIHIIMATQRPSVDVITGTIKANFPTRISFQVTSKIDSRTILSEQGAEQLLGQGDMLYMAGGGRISRIHGPFVSDGEVESVVAFLKEQGAPRYVDDITVEEDEDASGEARDKSDDPMYDEALNVILREGKVSTSFIQRHLQVGYNRAARIIEKMEQEGVVSKANATGKREILIR